MASLDTTPDAIETETTSSPDDVVSTSSQQQEDEEDEPAAAAVTTPKSALRENIERKGKHAYYFAHAHKADGPAWDGKQEPKLLSRQESQQGHRVSTVRSSFDYFKSNITTYAFLDDGKKVKLYIDMEGIGEKCTDEDVELDFTESSLSLVIQNYRSEPQCLVFAKLTATISTATFRKKKDKIILTLVKVDEAEEWLSINEKAQSDDEGF